jgi:DNA-binding XRE family transcriptional regulator
MNNTRAIRRAACKARPSTSAHARPGRRGPSLPADPSPPSLYAHPEDWLERLERQAWEQALATRTLIPESVREGHQLARANMQTSAQLENGRVCRVGLSTHERTDLLHIEPRLRGNGILAHLRISSYQKFYRLTQRSMVRALWFGLSLRRHERKPYASDQPTVRTSMGYHGLRQLSALQTGGFSVSEDHQHAKDLAALGDAIRECRASKQLTQKRLALLARVPQRTIQALEAGRLDPELDLLEMLAEALNVRPSVLFVRAEEIKQAKEAGETSEPGEPNPPDPGEPAW